MPASALNTIPLTTSTGATVNVRAHILADGTVAVAHAFVDTANNQIDVARNSSVQAIIATLRSMTPPT